MIASAVIPIRPLSKERPRTGRSGHVYTPKRTAEYEQAIRGSAIGQLPDGYKIPTCPVRLVVMLDHAVAKSWSKKDKAAALAQKVYPSKGDLDNKVKAIQDALNGVYYVDDVQIVSLRADMRYAEKDMVHVAVYEIGSEHEANNGGSASMGR